MLSKDLLEELRRRFGNRVIPVVIRFDQALREAASFGQPVVEYSPDSTGAHDYQQLADWLTAHSLHKRGNALEDQAADDWPASPAVAPPTDLSQQSRQELARLGLSASALVPVLPQRLSRQEGAVELHGSFYRLGGVLEATGPQAPVSLRLTAAAGVGRLQLSGQASPNYEGVTESRWVACPSLGVTARFALAPHLRLFVDGNGSIAFPKTVVRVAGREATEWGRPALSAALGLELSASVGQQ